VRLLRGMRGGWLVVGIWGFIRAKTSAEADAAS
jgi:hypothetical protein